MEPGVVIVVLVALVFDFTNGFHDAANSIATVVSTRVLSPRRAVMWAAFFNFAAFLVFGTEVATTIAKDVVDPMRGVLTVGVVFAGLIGAIGWNLTTFYLGLPTSSSHALVGGMAGAAVARGGFGVLQEEGLRKIGVFIVLSPLVGLALALVFTLVIMWTFRRVRRVDLLNANFRRGQLVSAAAFSLGHGGNDAQKTMGVILAVLIGSGHLSAGADVPLWVVLAAHAAIGAGTLSGGWRIVKTMGSNHAAPAGRWVRGRVGGRGRPVLHIVGGHPGLHHPHHHRGHRRRGRGPPALGGSLGRRRPGRVGVGPHHPRRVRDRLGRRERRAGGLVIDRRITFFLAAAMVCALMTPLAPGELRWLPVATAVTYLVLAILVALESLSSRSRRDLVDDDGES